MSKSITDRQKQILQVVARRNSSGRPAPSYRELGEILAPQSPVSTSVVRYHVFRLVAAGLVTHDDRVARSIALTPRAIAQFPELAPPATCSPLVDAVRAAVEAGESLPAGVLAAFQAVA